MSFAISVCFGYRLSISISIGLGHLHSILVRCLAIPLGHRTKQPEFYAFFVLSADLRTLTAQQLL